MNVRIDYIPNIVFGNRLNGIRNFGGEWSVLVINHQQTIGAN
jgi:hypothetical protein